MSQAQATRLAERARQETAGDVRVEPEGRYFVVTVETAAGSWTIRDAVDWAWLRRQVLGSG